MMDIYPNKLLIITNTGEKRYRKKIIEGIKKLTDSGFECLLLNDDYKKLYGKENKTKTNIKDVDYICSMGGDGALLYAGQYAIKYDKPIFGINYGHVGYLCGFNKDENINPELLSKRKIENHPLLECKIKNKEYYAINDIVVGKDNFGKTTSLKVNVDNKDLCEFRSDGVVVASKLGSNAYSKACGAPVIVTKNKFIITAICPCYGEFKYKQVLDKMKITISLLSKHYPASIYCDGEKIASLNNSVTINKADKQLRIIQ